MSGPKGWVPGPNAHFAREFDPAARIRIEALEQQLRDIQRYVLSEAVRNFQQAVDAIEEPEESKPGHSERANRILKQARFREAEKEGEGKNPFEITFEQFTRAREIGNLTVGQRYRLMRGLGAINESFASGNIDQGIERGFQDFAQVISPFIPGAHLAQIATTLFKNFIENRLKEILDARAEEIKATVDKSLAQIENKFAFLTSKDYDRTRFRNEVSSGSDPIDLQRQGWISSEAATIEGV